jgi:hypothetical protein
VARERRSGPSPTSSPALPVPTGRPLQVLSVPAGHPYVTGMTGGRADRVVVRPDPDPEDPSRAATSRWWPPVALDASWVEQQTFDLLHVHFGFDASTPDDLERLLDVLDRTGRPLVLTVHDLRSPHQVDSGVLDAQLDVLVPRAAAVITLTRAAAETILRRWGRTAVVLPHPPLVDLATMRRLRQERVAGRGGVRPEVVVGVSCKSLRANTDPLRLLPCLEETVRGLDGVRLVVDLHHDLWTDGSAGARTGVAGTSYRESLVHHLREARQRGVEVVVHEPYDDDALWRHLAGLDVVVLPYRFGTHSGWLEACHDVGTRVLAPALGCYADQGADAVFTADEDRVDLDSLAAGVARLVQEARTGSLAGHDADHRAASRERARDEQVQIYEAVVAGAVR